MDCLVYKHMDTGEDCEMIDSCMRIVQDVNNFDGILHRPFNFLSVK